MTSNLLYRLIDCCLCIFQALEGLGESLQVESQDVDPLRENLSGPSNEYDSQKHEVEKSDCENNVDGISMGLKGLALSDRGWISPPETIGSVSSDSEASNVENCVDLDTTLPGSDGSDSQHDGDCLHSTPDKADSNNVLIPPEKVDSNNEQVLIPPEQSALNLFSLFCILIFSMLKYSAHFFSLKFFSPCITRKTPMRIWSIKKQHLW